MSQTQQTPAQQQAAVVQQYVELLNRLIDAAPADQTLGERMGDELRDALRYTDASDYLTVDVLTAMRDGLNHWLKLPESEQEDPLLHNQTTFPPELFGSEGTIVSPVDLYWLVDCCETSRHPDTSQEASAIIDSADDILEEYFRAWFGTGDS